MFTWARFQFSAEVLCSWDFHLIRFTWSLVFPRSLSGLIELWSFFNIKKQKVSRQRHSLTHSGVCPSVPGFPDLRYQVDEQTGESGIAVYHANNYTKMSTTQCWSLLPISSRWDLRKSLLNGGHIGCQSHCSISEQSLCSDRQSILDLGLLWARNQDLNYCSGPKRLGQKMETL